ncbi:hypothetical protein [Halalkalibacter kiskunsagensis]|uniref:hypothetical protein n=1 Tax=Halalkalibacter kiskunsagensis TaxID=1548599 RepID=UPI003007F4B0
MASVGELLKKPLPCFKARYEWVSQSAGAQRAEPLPLLDGLFQWLRVGEVVAVIHN